MKKGKKIVKLIVLVLVIGLIIGVYSIVNAKPTEYRTFTATIGNVETIVDGSGVISASKSRKEYSKVSSEITDIYFEEGEEVKSGDVIMKLDSSIYQNTINSQNIAINQSELSKQTIEKQIRDLNIVANATGYVNNLSIKEGSYITTTMGVCDIVENNAYEIVLQFVYNENALIKVGNRAILTLLNNYSALDGTVTKVSDMRKAIDGNAQVVDVTIEIKTPGYSLAGITAKGEVYINDKSILSVNTSAFSQVSLNTVRAKTTGTVKTVSVSEGAYVKKGDVIAILENNDLTTNLENVNLALQNQYNQLFVSTDGLDDYEVVAKIDGIITALPFDEGDLVAAGSLLATISNNEIMEFKIPVDELDVAKIKKNQEVRVSIDALPETKENPLEGRVTMIPLEGVTVGGVTDYNVTIQLEGRDDIRISMSANADIVISSAENVLLIPIDSVIYKNGKQYVEVLETNEKGEKVATEREVLLGVSDSTYIEVISGVKEGDEVVIPTVSANHMGMMSGMHPGME